MNKEYMLQKVRERIDEIETKIRDYYTTDGPSKSYSGAACMRSRLMKDLNILKLLEYLLMYAPSSMIIDQKDLTNAFDRLVEPRRLR